MCKILFSFFFLSLSFLQSKIVWREAFDFGSGTIRLHFADVDIAEHQVKKSIYTETLRVFLSEDLKKSADRKFSEEIQEAALNAGLNPNSLK